MSFTDLLIGMLRLMKRHCDSSVLGQQSLVIIGDFYYPNIFWENNTTVYQLSTRFLECIEGCFLIQILDMFTRNSTLIDILLIN